MLKWIKLLGLLSVLLCLWFFVRATDFAAVAGLLKKTGLRFCYLIGITLVAYIFGSLSWWYCLGKDRRSVSIGQLFVVRHIGETLSLINPMSIIAGETAKVYLLKDIGIARPITIASILIARVFLIISQLTLMMLVLIPFLWADHQLSVNRFYAWAILSLLLFTVVCWMLYTKFADAPALSGIQKKITRIAEAWNELFLYSKSALLLAFFFALLHWIFGALEFYLIIRFLGFNVSLLKGMLVDLGVVVFKSAGAFIPAQLGVEEYGNKTMIAVVGIQSATLWVAASILRRSRQLFWIAIGCCAWLFVRLMPQLTDKKKNGNFIY